MNARRNRQWRVSRYPSAEEPIDEQQFEFVTTTAPEPEQGQFLVRTICLAPGPAQRGYLDKQHADFFANVPVGDVMRGRGIGQIVESRHPEYQVGDLFVGSLGWQDYSLQHPRGAEFVFSTKKILSPVYPLSIELGVLGQAGATAYFGLHEAGQIKPGDNVLVSAAAGGVGSTACQIARLSGANKVVGITGSEDKCEWLRDTLHVDATINYKTDNIGECLNELFPDGIDLFFDNVGGEILNTALEHLAMHARIALCGYIATDYATDPGPGPINYRYLVQKRSRMQGFIVFDYWKRFAEAEMQLRNWYSTGELIDTNDISEGLEAMPSALNSLFTGDNRGVKICRVSPDPAVDR